jgi:hypothetical protein
MYRIHWARHKGAILCPSVGYNYTLNSKAETYVRITKEHMRCLLRRSNAPRRLWLYAVQQFCRVYGWLPRNKRVSAPPWTRVGPHCRVKFDRDRDLRVFGSLCYGHLPKEHRLVENKTMDDRGLEGAFLMNDNDTPTFWLWSFKLRKPVNVRDGVFYDLMIFSRFKTPSCLSVLPISRWLIFMLCISRMVLVTRMMKWRRLPPPILTLLLL